jgi:hypothetical protein
VVSLTPKTALDASVIDRSTGRVAHVPAVASPELGDHGGELILVVRERAAARAGLGMMTY